jgi:hypothetical protein
MSYDYSSNWYRKNHPEIGYNDVIFNKCAGDDESEDSISECGDYADCDDVSDHKSDEAFDNKYPTHLNEL